jgi:hypothetical protein
VKTFDEKRNPISRYYYIDVNAAIEGEMSDEALVAVTASDCPLFGP